MTGRTPPVYVLDGHDGAGKTSLARAFADRSGGRFIEPFADTLGSLLDWLRRQDRFKVSSDIARLAVDKAITQNRDAKLLVFDRHWLTFYSVLPRSLFDDWIPRPATVLCWTDPETTVRRLRERGENPGECELHEIFCKIYRDLAEEFGVPILDTSHRSVPESLRELEQMWGSAV